MMMRVPPALVLFGGFFSAVAAAAQGGREKHDRADDFQSPDPHQESEAAFGRGRHLRPRDAAGKADTAQGRSGFEKQVHLFIFPFKFIESNRAPPIGN